MHRLIRMIWVGLLIGGMLQAQSALQMQGNALEVFSSATEGLDGLLTRPQFSPFPTQVISFERISDNRNFLYVYDLAAKSLTEVRTVIPEAGVKLGLEDSLKLAGIYHTQLDWRPVLDDQGRQWFAFKSNGASDNADIYLGFAGGTTFLRLTTNESVDETPKWSPDGRQLAFISHRSGNGDIYVVEEVENIIAELNRNADNFRLKQVTNTPLEEKDIAWNPDPNAQLIAFSQLVRFEGRQVPTYQIRVADVLATPELYYPVTNDPLANYSRPSWNPHTGAQLLFVGEGLLDDQMASLYLVTMEYNADGNLHNKDLEGLKSEIFPNVHLAGTYGLWLAGGDAILCQENRPEQNYPLYSVNVQRRLEKKEQSVYYFGKLHTAYPYILEFDARKNNFIFVNQESDVFKIYLAQIYGDDIIPYRLPEYTLTRSDAAAMAQPVITKESLEAADNEAKIIPVAGIGLMQYLLYGGAAAVGTAAYFIISNNGDDPPKTKTAIGLPPNMP